MAEVQIYRTSYCPYCDMAKRLFQELGVAFEEIDVTHDDDARAELIKRTGGRRTVPQIFINGEAVGGYSDVRALQTQGKLTEMLAASK
ncbi:MAG: glutaredoxin 3 [Bradymonadaceae bacterium]|nr:glutaredoxin 3 [Lujinxingiaceae bacterium]